MSTNDPNANRPGYKETKVGWIPEEWEARPLQKLTTGSELGGNYTGSLSETGTPLIKMGNMVRGSIDLRKLERLSPKCDPNPRDFLSCGDFLFNTRNTLELVGKTCLWRGELERAVFNSNILRVRFDSTRVESTEFACRAFNTQYALRQLRSFAIGTTSVAAIYWRDLQRFLLILPPLPEQQKIAAILSTCDAVIEKTTELIQAKQRQKKTLMQQLLTGKKRLPGFEGEWREVRLSEVSNRLTQVADNPSGYPVLSITAGRGFVSQEDKFSRVIAGKQVENYVLLTRGQFSYNKGNSYRYPQGCVYRLEEYDEGLVPNVFYSFATNDTLVESEFLKQYFLAGLHNKDLYRWINSGVRNNGLLNLNSGDFFNLPIRLPDLAEQKAIGNILKNADSEIVHLEQKLAALKQQKKALMQKLLTGQVRVPVDGGSRT